MHIDTSVDAPTSYHPSNLEILPLAVKFIAPPSRVQWTNVPSMGQALVFHKANITWLQNSSMSMSQLCTVAQGHQRRQAVPTINNQGQPNCGGTSISFLASNGQTFPLRNLWLHVGFFLWMSAGDLLTILFLRKILGVWQKWMAGIRCLHMSSAKNACRTSPMFNPIHRCGMSQLILGWLEWGAKPSIPSTASLRMEDLRCACCRNGARRFLKITRNKLRVIPNNGKPETVHTGTVTI